MNPIEQLDQLIVAIRAVGDPRRATTEWKQAWNHLKKTDLDRNVVDNMVMRRDLDKLVEMVASLKAPAATDAAPDPDAPDDATCQAAIKMFRKRLKFMRLDDESKISSRNPLTSGGASEIKIVQAPLEYPAPVWKELVRRGKLFDRGQGFYELTGK